MEKSSNANLSWRRRDGEEREGRRESRRRRRERGFIFLESVCQRGLRVLRKKVKLRTDE